MTAQICVQISVVSGVVPPVQFERQFLLLERISLSKKMAKQVLNKQMNCRDTNLSCVCVLGQKGYCRAQPYKFGSLSVCTWLARRDGEWWNYCRAEPGVCSMWMSHLQVCLVSIDSQAGGNSRDVRLIHK